MPKAKRPRLEAELTHEEIWDDSALLSSWNDALKEYKNYHSLHARGITVSKALERHDAAQQAGAEDLVKAVFEQDDSEQEMAHDGSEVRHDEHTGHDTTYNGAGEWHSEQQLKDEFGRNTTAGTAAPHLGSVPAALFNGAGPAVDNPALKNLMMSWYYAGYYTGLHEGEQRALAQSRTAGVDEIGNR